MSEMGLDRGGRWEGGAEGGAAAFPFQPQSLTVVPLNINWHRGTGSGQITCPWLAHYIRMEHDIIVSCNAFLMRVNARVGATWESDLSEKFVRHSRDVNTGGCYAPCGRSLPPPQPLVSIR